MKNKLIDLNNHLFAQIERLSDEDVKGEALTEEIERSRAIGNIAMQIISNANLALKAQIAINDGLIKTAPQMLGMNSEY